MPTDRLAEDIDTLKVRLADLETEVEFCVRALAHAGIPRDQVWPEDQPEQG